MSEEDANVLEVAINFIDELGKSNNIKVLNDIIYPLTKKRLGRFF